MWMTEDILELMKKAKQKKKKKKKKTGKNTKRRIRKSEKKIDCLYCSSLVTVQECYKCHGLQRNKGNNDVRS